MAKMHHIHSFIQPYTIRQKETYQAASTLSPSLSFKINKGERFQFHLSFILMGLPNYIETDKKLKWISIYNSFSVTRGHKLFKIMVQ